MLKDAVLAHYRPLRRIAEGVHVIEAERGPSFLPRRMSILTLDSGELLAVNAVALSEEDHATLKQLGRLRWMVIPNGLHAAYADDYASRYPDLRILVPPGARNRLATRLPRIDGILDEGEGTPYPSGVTVACLKGVATDETVLLHHVSRTLFVADLVFNFRRDDFRGGVRLFMNLNGALDRFGPSRLFRYTAVKDHAALKHALSKILEWDFGRVVPTHGHILESGGREALREGFRWLGL